MSIRTMSKVWESSQHSGSNLLMLLAVADFSDDDGVAFPAVQKLAKKCRMSKRNAQDRLRELSESGELTILKNQGPPPKYPNLFKVNLDALGVKPTAPVQPTSPVQYSVERGAAHCMAGVKPTAPKPSVNHQEPSTEPSATPMASFPEQGAKKKTSPISLANWLKDCEASGVTPIPEDDPVFEFAESAGISLDLISLAWSEFKVRHGDGSKRQKDWRATFRNAVRGNWFKIWFVGNDGQVQISSQGRTLQAVHREAAA